MIRLFHRMRMRITKTQKIHHTEEHEMIPQFHDN
jgi:hypothetical protein